MRWCERRELTVISNRDTLRIEARDIYHDNIEYSEEFTDDVTVLKITFRNKVTVSIKTCLFFWKNQKTSVSC